MKWRFLSHLWTEKQNMDDENYHLISLKDCDYCMWTKKISENSEICDFVPVSRIILPSTGTASADLRSD